MTNMEMANRASTHWAKDPNGPCRDEACLHV